MRPQLRMLLAVGFSVSLWAYELAADDSPSTVLLGSAATWSYPNRSFDGNPFDLKARAEFKHVESGEVRSSELFFCGDGTWSVRFSGTRPGKWSFMTQCDGQAGTSANPNLHDLSGTISVSPQPHDGHNGFMTHFGSKWGWEGTQKAFIPQYVMARELDAYYDFGRHRVDEAKIDRDIQEFIVEHGFTGFHLQGQGRWFGLDGKPNDNLNPDLRTYEVVEIIIRKVHAKGGACHIWMWGSDKKGRGGDGPRALAGGPMSKADRRNLRYFAARLGPLPGWSLGYGFDTENFWASPDELTAWKTFLEERLGWDHFIGSRVGFDEKGPWGQFGKGIEKAALNEKFNAPIGEEYLSWPAGDYIGYTSYRPLYDRYVEAITHRPNMPSFEEDRFRLRDAAQWTHKDYWPELTRKGLWHSAMAGGVANIWGNLLPKPNEGGSQSYDHGDVQIRDQINTYATFFRDRFRKDFVHDNALAEPYEGTTETPEPADISVCLRSPANRHFVFYRERAKAVGMDLRGMEGPQPVVAVDTQQAYQEIDLGQLPPRKHTWTAPYKSDWAIAVGEYD